MYVSGDLIAHRFEVVQGPSEKPTLAGAMGAVYFCLDRTNNIPVAIKTFQPRYLSERKMREQFLRECTIWLELSHHPHIVRCYEVTADPTQPAVFLVLEWVAEAERKSDSSLRSWLAPDTPLELEQALLFGLHIARGMKHATTQVPTLIHLDLKPENILVGRDLHARVTDFGVARIQLVVDNGLSAATVDKSPQRLYINGGTPRYMAPERWGNRTPDLRADIYAFGCILFEMVAGRPAVKGQSAEDLKRAHVGGYLEELPIHLPDEVGELIHVCTALERNRRYKNWAEVETAIQQVYRRVIGKDPPVEPLGERRTRERKISIGWSYNQVGLSYHELGKFDAALSNFNWTLDIAETEGERALEAAALGNLGNVYYVLGNLQDAIAYHERDLTISREVSDRVGEGTALYNLGNAYATLHDGPRAIEKYEQALAIMLSPGYASNKNQWVFSTKIQAPLSDALAIGDILNSLGTVYAVQGYQRKALFYYEQALAIARQLKDQRREGVVLSNVANAYERLGDIPQSIELHKQHLTIAQKIVDRYEEGRTLLNLGNAHVLLGDVRQALDWYSQGLAIAQEIGDRQAESIAFHSLGTAYEALADAPRAIEHYEQSLIIAQEIGDQQVKAKNLDGLGNAYALLDDVPRAVELHNRAVSILREIEDKYGEATSLSNLANDLSSSGDIRGSIICLEQVLILRQEIEDLSGEGITLARLGRAYQALGDTHRALESCEKGLAIAQKIGDQQMEARTLLDLGNIFVAVGDFDRAKESYEQGLVIAQEIGDRTGEGTLLNALGGAYTMIGDAEQGLHFIELALEAVRETGDRRLIAHVSFNLANLLRAKNRLVEAAQCAKTAAQIFAELGHSGHARQAQALLDEIMGVESPGLSVSLESYEDGDDDELLRMEPISRKRMDLLWLDPPRLAALESIVVQDGAIILEIEGREHEITLEDVQWAKEIEHVVDRAYSASQRGNYAEAITHYEAALRLAPGCDLFLMSIGSGYASLGQLERGLAYLVKAAEISPENSRVASNLIALRRMIDPDA